MKQRVNHRPEVSPPEVEGKSEEGSRNQYLGGTTQRSVTGGKWRGRNLMKCRNSRGPSEGNGGDGERRMGVGGDDTGLRKKVRREGRTGNKSDRQKKHPCGHHSKRKESVSVFCKIGISQKRGRNGKKAEGEK